MKQLNRILYIEDEPDIQKIVQICLENIGGYKVSLANDGVEGLQMMLAEKPDLILLDVMMPKIDGPTMLKRIRKISEFNDVPIVFITAKVGHADKASYLTQGVSAIISKPFDPMTLADKVRAIWDRRND